MAFPGQRDPDEVEYIKRLRGDLDDLRSTFIARAVINSPWTTTFIPQVDQGATTNITKTITKSQWHYDGSMIEFEFFLICKKGGEPVGLAEKIFVDEEMLERAIKDKR